MSAKPRKQDPLSCTFKIYDPEHAKRLLEEAEECRTSYHQRAGQIVAQYFEERDAQRKEIVAVENQLKRLREELRLARGDLATSVQALLVHAGHTQPADAAKWVEDYLLSRSKPDD